MMKRRLLAAVAAIGAVALTATACGGGGGAGGGGGDNGGGEGVQPGDPITWMATLHTPATPDPNGPIQTALEEYTGVEFDIEWVPAANTSEKLNAVLASNTLADLTSLNQVGNSSVRTALSSGMFWDVEPYLSEFDNLSQIDPLTIDAARVDGGLYGVPFQKPLARYGVLVRQDWLDNLGLEVPHTLDELAEVAQAFTHDDPDGNGQDDTTGFIDRLESFSLGFRILSGYFGAGDTFVVDENGEFQAAFASEEFKEAMAWYKDVYDSGAVNQEFITTQKSNQQDMIAQDRGGIVVTGLFEARNYVNLARNADPDSPMEWALVNDMTWGDVERRIISDTAGGMGGLLAISKQNVPTEEGLRYILGFVDSLLDEEPFGLMTNGVEGTHYEEDGEGVITITDQNSWEQQVQPYSSSRPADQVVLYPTNDEYTNLSNELMAENAEYAVTNPAQPLTSDTFDTQWSTIFEAAQDAYFKYMVGQLDMAGYEAAIEALGGQGLDAVLAEFGESYAAVNG